MPIKLPRGFPRRKSSGNALEEVRNPPATGGDSSFRVLERPADKAKSFDAGMQLKLGSDDGPRVPPKDFFQTQEENDVFATERIDSTYRGSGGTDRSHSTVHNDSAASSARLSTSSTNPSSIETKADTRNPNAAQKSTTDLTAPPSSAKPGFLRDSSRTFSFGIGKKSSPTTSPGAFTGNRRARTATTSTASTATPPRLFDSDLALENTELDGFGNMFDHIGTSTQQQSLRAVQPEELTSSPPPLYPPSSYHGPSSRLNRPAVPQPIRTDRSQAVESSPYSWTSHDSHEGLIRSPSPSKTITQLSPPKPRQQLSSNSSNPPVPPPHRQSPEKEYRRMDTSRAAEETKLLSMSPPLHQEGGHSPSSLHGAPFDPSIAADAELANMYEQTKTIVSKPVSTNKVMTPEQWERYKQQKEMDRRLGALSDDSGSEAEDNYDDEDEIEKSKQAVKQRRKQEAHLAVYRQQMMKVTGEAAPPRSESSLGILHYRNGSSGDLNNRLSNLTVESRQSGGRSSGEDDVEEDEDIPLGILAAHGFPNKNRPPVRLTSSSSNPNLKSLSQPPPQASPSIISGQASKPGNLPVFARHLPQDPYFGASLVNHANRESLASQVLSPSAIGSGPSTAHPIHPAGLVGVIAGEERARAARRGSPNPTGNYDMPGLGPHPGMLRSQTTGNIPTMGMMPGMPPMLSPADQAQLQMSQQMNQMMQMQMQWMQQMQSMMVGPPGMPMPMGPPTSGAPSVTGFQIPRPQSMHGPAPPFNASQRTMSTMGPGSGAWNSTPSFIPSINVNGNYAPSIAPSERSNVGLAPRYRPVSMAPEQDANPNRRASTFTSSSYQPWSNRPQGGKHVPKASINTVGRKSPLAQQDEDDDEQGWAEMKKRKEKKQKSWALRKGTSGLEDLYTGTA